MTSQKGGEKESAFGNGRLNGGGKLKIAVERGVERWSKEFGGGKTKENENKFFWGFVRGSIGFEPHNAGRAGLSS